MRFSVVINTLNRAESLRTTLASLRHQHHDEFEVIVVNGPSTDGTEELLVEWAGRVKHLRCPVANLSMSRNIGIRAAAGDVVAFIDDDAVAEYTWLTELETGYSTDEIAGVGGVVYDHTGMDFQFRFGVSDRYGDTTQYDRLPNAEALCAPGSWSYPSLLGTNSSFRRSALATIGLFDETYEYYLDETDVAVRLVDAGLVVTGLAGAPVHHHFLPSHVRNSARTVTHWYPVVKNRTYFALRHASEHRTTSEILAAAVEAAESRFRECRWAEDHGMIPRGSSLRAREGIDRGLLDGIALARERGTGALPAAVLDPPEFLRFPTLSERRGRRVALVTSSFPPRPVGGISRFMSELAPALARAGHDVRVITRDDEHQHVAWRDGYWTHSIGTGARGLATGTFEHVDAFASSVVAELARIAPWTPVDAAYGGAWDVETLGLVRGTAIPTTVMLATPAAVAADEGGWWHDPAIAGRLQGLLDLERELFASADLVHGISRSIVDTIEHWYAPDDGPLLDADRTEVFPLGLIDRGGAPAGPREVAHDALEVFFVGRLEPRKGIDVFLTALEQVLPGRPDVRAVIAGADPDGAVERGWNATHHDHPWAGRVSFIGVTSDDELHDRYATSDIVVLPSRYESFGLVVVEAMMHHAAIVSSDVGGIAEVARAGVDALLVPPGDPTALADAIERLVDDADERRRLGAEARRRFEDTFTIDVSARGVAALLDRAVARPSVRATHLVTGDGLDVDGVAGHTTRAVLQTASTARLRVTQHGVAHELVVTAPGTRCSVGRGAGVIRLDVLDGAVTVVGLVDVRDGIR